MRLARLFASWVEEAPGWEVVAPVPFSVVCFRRDGSDEENAALLERVNATGEAYLSHTVLDGRYVLRLAVGNLRTTEDDVSRAWELYRRRRSAPKLFGPGDDEVGGLPELGRAFVGGDRDAPASRPAPRPAKASRSVVSSPA